MNRIINLLLRVCALAIKFLFTVLLARYLSVEEVGSYGLVVSVVAYLVFIYGLDFYYYSNRFMQRSSASDDYFTLGISSHVLIVSSIFGIAFVFIFLIRLLGYPIPSLWLLVLVLGVVEYCSVEFGRYLVLTNRQLTATVTLLLRTGVWMLLIGVALFAGLSISLPYILAVWLFFSIVSLVIAGYFLRDLIRFGQIFKVDVAWLVAGLKVSGPMFLSTMALRAGFLIDRVFWEAFFPGEMLGAYVLFTSLALSIQTVVDSAVLMYLYPYLLKSWSCANWQGLLSALKRALILTTFFILAFVAGSIMLLDFVLNVIGNVVYFQYKSMYWIYLLAIILFLYSMLAHFVLYSAGRDRVIRVSHYAGLLSMFLYMVAVVFLGANWIYFSFAPLVFFSTIFAIKVWYGVSELRKIKEMSNEH